MTFEIGQPLRRDTNRLQRSVAQTIEMLESGS